jgi:hypothetical protein
MELQCQVLRPPCRGREYRARPGLPGGTSSHFSTTAAKSCASIITSWHPNRLCQRAAQLNRAGTWRAKPMGR